MWKRNVECYVFRVIHSGVFGVVSRFNHLFLIKFDFHRVCNLYLSIFHCRLSVSLFLFVCVCSSLLFLLLLCNCTVNMERYYFFISDSKWKKNERKSQKRTSKSCAAMNNSKRFHIKLECVLYSLFMSKRVLMVLIRIWFGAKCAQQQRSHRVNNKLTWANYRFVSIW